MARSIVKAAVMMGAIALAATSAIGEQPCSTDWLSEDPCELTAEEREELQRFTDETIAAETPLSRYELRTRSSELIFVESPRVTDGYWQALVTIENKTKNLIPSNTLVRCLLFDVSGSRLALSTPVAPSDDLGPGDSFTAEALAEIPGGARVARHECKFGQ